MSVANDGFDDDEFGDFGGFEAAEPVNVPEQDNPPVQAASNVWASMFVPAMPGTSSVQPDLLCGQERFPQHLDNPVTVDVASSAQASVQPVDVVRQDGMGAGSADLQAEDEFDLDSINLANDILDGSFRSNSQSGAGIQSHGLERMPDISGLDLASGVLDGLDTRNIPLIGNRQNVPSPSAVTVQNSSTEVQKVDSRSNTNQNEESVDHVTSRSRANQNAESAGHLTSRSRANQNAESADHVTVLGISQIVRGEPDNAQQSAASVLLEKAREEKEAVQKELEQQQHEISRLSEDLARAHELADTARRNYEQLQEKHKKELEELRAAGHETLGIIVEEYKVLLQTTIQKQQEISVQRLVERLKEEAEKWRKKLDKQKVEFDRLQEEQRQSSEEKLKQTVEEMKQKQKEEFDSLLREEKWSLEESIRTEINKQKEASSAEIQRVIQLEQEKSNELRDKQQEVFTQKLSAEVERHKKQTEEVLSEQKVQFQDQLKEFLTQKSAEGKELTQQAVQQVREDMNTYLQEQRQNDRALQRRQLASLDLFLESARHQLSLLMDNGAGLDNQDQHPKKTEENS